MPSLAALAFLQCVIYVTMGADPPFRFTPSMNNEGIVPYPVFGAGGPINPDIRPNFGVGLPHDDVGAEDKRNFPFTKNPVVAEYKPNSFSAVPQPSELSFSEWISRVNKKEHQLRDYFADNYIRKIKACKKLRKVFQVQRQFDAKSLSSYFYKLVFEAQTSIGNLDAKVDAEVESKAMAVNFDNLKKDDFLYSTAQAVAKYLSFRDVFTTTNVASLSQQLFTSIEKNLSLVKNPSPEENFKAIFAGYINYVKSLGLYTPHSVAMFSGLFANEMYSLERKSHHKRHHIC